MTGIRRLLLVLGGLLCMAAGPAPRLVTDLSIDRIDISYSFSGADLLLFGAIDGMRGKMSKDVDIVTVVRGPTAPVTMRRKGRVAGLWLNVDAVDLQTAPGFYAISSTRPIRDIASGQTATIYELGLAELHLSPTGSADQSAADVKGFRDAFLRIRHDQKLASEDPGGVRIVGDVLYRARVHLPANVPIGDFRAEIFLLRKGEVIARTTTSLSVAKSGFERSVYNFAHEDSATYGLLAIFLALGFGGLAAWVFRR